MGMKLINGHGSVSGFNNVSPCPVFGTHPRENGIAPFCLIQTGQICIHQSSLVSFGISVCSFALCRDGRLDTSIHFLKHPVFNTQYVHNHILLIARYLNPYDILNYKVFPKSD
jgi:hypothetical protein